MYSKSSFIYECSLPNLAWDTHHTRRVEQLEALERIDQKDENAASLALA
jgi:hypothetical protein